MSALSVGCSTNAPLNTLQNEGPSTSELMRAAPLSPETTMPSTSTYQVPGRTLFDYNYSHYTRDAMNELDVLFPRLPNPTLVMYVYPYIARSGVPVPGYSTAFPLFDQPHYALPGEAPTHLQGEW
ncbi:TIGR03751 family conjugal transfer lipoprotein [Thiomicrospira aerophila]|uniref:TIGR03751 family conjugal transfer lipoprotein n=1 Tax=Thiomicrospira aerophila TaxID=92245 RepID=UPI0002D3EE85